MDRSRRRKSGDGPGQGSTKSRKIADFMQPSQVTEVEKATNIFAEWLFASQCFQRICSGNLQDSFFAWYFFAFRLSRLT